MASAASSSISGSDPLSRSQAKHSINPKGFTTAVGASMTVICLAAAVALLVSGIFGLTGRIPLVPYSYFAAGMTLPGAIALTAAGSAMAAVTLIILASFAKGCAKSDQEAHATASSS